MKSPTLVFSQRSANFGFVLALLLISGFQILSMPPWIFSTDGFDQWFYHGFFLHLKHHIVAFAGSYYGTRLAWILPGALVYKFWSPIAANAILRILLSWTSLASVFFLITRSYGRRCGLIAGLLLCANPDFLTAIGWDYVDGAGMAYSLLGFEELGASMDVASSARMRAVRGIFAGLAFAAAVHSNVFLLILAAPALLFLFGHAGVKGLARISWVLTGGGIMTVALGLANLALGGQFLFFLPSLTASAGLIKLNPYYVSPSVWVPQAIWLVIPSGIAAASIVLILKLSFSTSRPWIERKTRLIDAACLPLLFLIFVAMTANGASVLQAYYYATYLTILIPLLTGAMIGRELDSWTRARFSALACGSGALALLVGTNPVSWLPRALAAGYEALEVVPILSLYWLAAILFLGIAIALVSRLRAIGVVSVVVAGSMVALHIGHTRLRESAAGENSRALFLDTDNTSRELGRFAGDKPLWFWYSYGREKDQHYSSIASTYLWATMLMGREMPDPTDARFGVLKRGVFLAMMDTDPLILDQATKVLRDKGFSLEPVAQLRSNIGQRAYVTSLVQVTDVDLAPTLTIKPPDAQPLKPLREIFNFDLTEVLAHCDHSFYGKPPAVPESTPKGVFRITDPRDHFGTRFQPVKEFASMDAVEVIISDQELSKKYGTINMIVQDQDYQILYWSGTLSHGSARTIIGIPKGIQGIRIAFLANDDGYIRFPKHVELVALKASH
jgi:hypothetical protein